MHNQAQDNKFLELTTMLPDDVSLDSFKDYERRLSQSKKEDGDASDSESDEDTEPSFLVWRRLHLSKAKLKGVTDMAALMAGFSVVATVELNIEEGVSEYLLAGFAMVTSLLVTTTMLALMIATCLLPHLEAVSKLNSTKIVKQSPHDALISYVDLSWVLANTVSIFLFIVDVILLSWIKFAERAACIAVTVIMIPVLLLLIIFGLIFYRQSVQQQYVNRKKKCDIIEADLDRILNNTFQSSSNSLHQSRTSLQIA